MISDLDRWMFVCRCTRRCQYPRNRRMIRGSVIVYSQTHDNIDSVNKLFRIPQAYVLFWAAYTFWRAATCSRCSGWGYSHLG